MDKINAKLLQATILLDRECRLIRRLVQRNTIVLRDVEASITSKSTTFAQVLDVYNYVFALVDHLARYQKIATSIPRLSQKSLEFRALNTGLGKIKDARDQLQHLNNDIENDFSGPLLGSVSWVANQKHYLVGLNDLGRQRSMPSIIFDTHTNTYVHDFCFTYGETYFDLSRAISAVATFNDYALRIIQIEVNGKPYCAEKEFVAIAMAFATTFLADDGASTATSVSET